MTISASEAETAGITFGGAFLGYLASAGFTLSTTIGEHAAIAGGVAALAVLGYHAYSGNVLGAATAATKGA